MILSRKLQQASTKLARTFATLDGVALVETKDFLLRNGKWEEACKQVAASFEKTGCLAIRDPRVNVTHNEEFLSMMEKYFEDRSKKFYAGEKRLPDFYPQLGYQTGATPEGIEKARDHRDTVAKYTSGNRADTPMPPPPDAKWRFFWRIGARPLISFNDVIDPPQHIPSDIPKWELNMNRWGYLMMDAVNTVSEMLAVGLGIPENTFTDKLKLGHHLLAPTGSDLDRYDLGTIFAGFHYDLNYITIHGKSRYPGLFVWLRDGTKVPVAIPEGCLLLQAGKQMEYLTGGYLKAGFHEVIYTEAVKAAKEKAKAQGKSTWRVSSTLFSHIRSDVVLEPIDKFATAENKKLYRPITAGAQVEEEIKAINLLQH